MDKAGRPPGIDGARLQAPRVLVVDDSHAMAGLLLRLLADMGLAAEWASSLTRAQDRIARERFAAVIADCAMVDGGSTDLLRHLRLTETAGTAFLLLTNRPEEAVADGAEDEGQLAFLAKPFPTSELRQALERLGLFERQRPGRQSYSHA